MPDPTPTHASADAKDPRRHSIAAKIIFLVFLCTFSTALVISWIAIQATHAQLRDRIDRGLPAALARTATALAPWLESGRTEIAAMAADRLTRHQLGSLTHSRAGHHPAARRMLEDFLAGALHFDAAAVLSSRGEWLASSESWPEDALPPAPWPVTDASPGTFAMRVRERGVAIAAAPLADDAGGPWLVARFKRDRIQSILASESREGIGPLLLTDGDGLVLASIGEDPLPPAAAEHAVAQLRARSSERVQEYASESGVHVLGAIARVCGPAEAQAPEIAARDWVLVVEAPFTRAFAPVLDVVTRIFVTDLVIIVVFIAFAYRITTRMLRPIEDLSEGARLASRGDLGQAISDPGTHDEIGRLTRSFNEMMGKLRESQAELRDANRQLLSQNEELQRANEVLSQLSITDGLTKLHNHRYFQESLIREIKRQGRTGKPLSMLLVDLDDFKQLNDRLGHASGDELLMRVASILDTTVRKSDLLARYGGEEFVVLATDTDIEGGIALAEKIRMAVEQAPHIVNDSLRPVRITVSVGVAQFAGNRRLFFEAADRALYSAKDQGKNCVVAAMVDSELD
jgi:diguanylate cyclase (GGDEF)-like protein